MNQDIQNQYTLHQKNGVAWKVPMVITNQTKFILKKRKYTQINRTHLVHESRYWKIQTFFAKKKIQTFTSGLQNMFVSCNIKPKTHPNESNPFWFIIQKIKKTQSLHPKTT